MNNALTVAAIALDIAWAEPKRNLEKVEEIIGKLPAETDIVVLPELFSTGFVADPDVLKVLATEHGDETLSKLNEISRLSGKAIAGSLLIAKGENYYNRGFIIEPSGEHTYYDKAHLFSLSTESKLMKSGTTLPPTVRFRGWNIALIICYDLRFPVWCRNVKKSYDVMLVPANWPKSREYAWRQLLIARAIENQAAFVGANRSGKDDFGVYDGMNLIVDAYGKPLNQSRENVEGDHVVIARLNYDHLEECRRKLPFQEDADEFLFKPQFSR